MKVNRKSDKQATLLSGMGVGAFVSLLVLLGGVGAASCFVSSGGLEIETARSVLKVMISIAVLLGIKVSNSLIKKLPAVCAIIQSTIMFVVLIGVHVFICDAKFQYVGGTALYILIGAVCAMLINPKSKPVRKIKNR